MAALAIASWRTAVIGRWAARIAGTLIVLLFLAFIVGEGLPAPSQLTAAEKLQFLGLFGLIAGLVLAWKWEGLGGLLGVAGFVLLVAISRSNARMSPFWFAAAVAGVHVVCWGRLRAGAPPGLVPWHLARGVVIGLASALGAFVSLCANEAFGQPPLMTPRLHPGPELAGSWRAGAQGANVALRIRRDASVTGTIDGVELAAARIRYGRSWFGKLMHWNADYLIEGELIETRITIPLAVRHGALEGAVFRGGRPTRVTLRRD